MPIYEFFCEDCGTVVEQQFTIAKRPDTIKCDCGKKAKRQISSCSWMLKGAGDGWPSQQLRRKNEMTKNNEAAGKRGAEDWRRRMPKLVYR